MPFPNIFAHPNTAGLLIVAGKTAVVYVFLVLGLRLMGKRELGQMNIYDLVLIVVLANAVQNAMVGQDTSLDAGLVAAATLLALNWLFSAALNRSQAVERWLIGEPVLIARDGVLMQAAARREGVTRDELMSALREHGLERLDQAAMCVLEPDGSISVVPKEAGVHRTRPHFRQLRLS